MGIRRTCGIALLTAVLSVPAACAQAPETQEPPGPAVSERIRVGRSPGAVALADLNEDGRLDLVVASEEPDLLNILLGDGAGRTYRMIGSAPVATGAAPTQLATGDLDADGRDDIAVSNMNSGTVSIARLSTDGRVVVGESIPVGRLPKGIAIGDLDADGKPDLAVANNGDNEVAILLAR